jgi:hypothetical protein
MPSQNGNGSRGSPWGSGGKPGSGFETFGFGIFLVWLGWFIFKETLTKTYTIRKR